MLSNSSVVTVGVGAIPGVLAARGVPVREARYVLTDIVANSNKFWHARLFADGAYETHWGRIGESGQMKQFSSAQGGASVFEAKCREKESKGYRLQCTVAGSATNDKAMSVRSSRAELADVAATQIQTDAPETLSLVRYLAQVNVHQILRATTLSYDASSGTFSTPLGIVTADGLAEARRLLDRIGGFVVGNDWGNTSLVGCLNDYLMLIPQNVGRSRPDPQTLFPTIEAVQRQNGVLDNLDASLKTALAAKAPADSSATAAPTPKLFEARLQAVMDEHEIERVRRKYEVTNQSIHACHQLEMKRLFSVEIAPMRRAFIEGGAKVGNVQELWHGTRASNLLSILRSGFVIPPATASHVTGRMWGNGVYFSDQSTKSLNYACGSAPRQKVSDGGTNDRVYMLLCNVAMGRSYIPSAFGERMPPFGFHSLLAKAGWSGVLNNEMVVYDTARINPTLLVEFGAPSK